MIICIPTEDERGVESKSFGHFGSAPYFTVVDMSNDRLEVLGKSECRHTGQHSHHLDQLQAHEVDAVVCEGIGRRAVAALNRQGIEVLSPACGTVGDIVKEVRAGNVHRLSVSDACGGGRHECGHAAGVGQGSRHGYHHRHRRGGDPARARTADQE